MNRRSFWKWLPAFLVPVVARGQRESQLLRDIPRGGTMLMQATRRDSATLIIPEWVYGNPKNNECPNCATMAEPYQGNRVFSKQCLNGTGELDHECFDKTATLVGPTERITRCKRCNAAFWQDAQ